MTVLGWTAVQLTGLHYYASSCRAFDEDRLQDARSRIALCLRCWPASPKAHLLAARIERLSGDFEKAASHLRECRHLEGTTELTQLELILLRAQNGELADVESALRDCVNAQHPETILILTALARAYMNNARYPSVQDSTDFDSGLRPIGPLDKARYRSANNCLTDLLIRNPKDRRGLFWRGLIRERLRDTPGAIEDYRSLLALAPERWKVRLRLLETLLSTGNAKEAAEHAEMLHATHGDDPDVRLASARCKILRGERDRAKDILDALIAERSNMGSPFYWRGTLETNNLATAEDWYRRALQAEPTLTEARFALYFNLQAQGKTAEANTQLATYRAMEDNIGKLKEVLTLLEHRPKDRELLTQAGQLLLEAGKEQSGRHFLYKALEIDERYTKAHEILGRHFEAHKNADKASYHLRMAGTR